MAIIKKSKTISKSKSKTKSNSNSNSRKHVNKFRKSSSKTRKMRGGTTIKGSHVPKVPKVHEVGPPKDMSHSTIIGRLGKPLPPIPEMKKKGPPMMIIPMRAEEEYGQNKIRFALNTRPI